MSHQISYIHGKKYDFTGFKHPGGPVALRLTFNREATQLFEAYHPFSTRAREVLAKYEVRDDGTETIHPLFDWSETSEFMEEMKSKVKPILGKPGTQYADTRRWIEYSIMFVLVLVTSIPFVKGNWIALVLFPVLMWVLGASLNHDASHMALSKNWRINQIACYIIPYVTSPLTWYHQHIIGHHVYTVRRMHHSTFIIILTRY
jgi:hypothetical protein